MSSSAEIKEQLLFVSNKIDEAIKQIHESKTQEIRAKQQEEILNDNSPNFIGRITSLKSQVESIQKNLEEVYNIDKVNQLESDIKKKEKILRELKGERFILNNVVKEQNKGINEFLSKFDSTKEQKELSDLIKKVKEENHNIKEIYKEMTNKMKEQKNKIDALEKRCKIIKQNIPEEISKEVNNFISSVFPSERFNEIKFLKTKEKADVEQIVEKIFKEEKLNFGDTQEITRLIIKKRSRRLLLNEINNYLNKSKNFNLSEFAYDTLYDIFKECVNLVQNDKDYKSAKIIVTLSKDIFRQSEDESEDKICLISDLKNEKIIKSYEFWKELIKYDIIEQMDLEKNDKINNKNDNNIKTNQIVINKLNLYINYMINFYCRPNCIRQIIETFNDYYRLDEKNIKNINKKIDEYENSEMNKNNISTISTEKTILNAK